MGNSTATKFLILEKAFELIYRNGYRATSVDEIIAKTNLTKGAFFYNFKNKDQMGLALINDFMSMHSYRSFVEPLRESKDPVRDIYKLMHRILLEDDGFVIDYGCPVHNLVEEMSSVNEGFAEALNGVIGMVREALVTCLERGIKAKHLKKSIDPEAVANFVISGYAGVRNLGKLYKTNVCYKQYLKELKRYLEDLQ